MTRVSGVPPSVQQHFNPWEKGAARSPVADAYLSLPAYAGPATRLAYAFIHPSTAAFRSIAARPRPEVYPGFQNFEIGNGHRFFYRVTDDGRLIVGGTLQNVADFLAIVSNSNVLGDLITTDFTSLETDATQIMGEFERPERPFESSSFTVTPHRDPKIGGIVWAEVRAKDGSAAATSPAVWLYKTLFDRFADAKQRSQFKTLTGTLTAERLNFAIERVLRRTGDAPEAHRAIGWEPLTISGPFMPEERLPAAVGIVDVGVVFTQGTDRVLRPSIVVRFKRYEFEEGGGITTGDIGQEADVAEWRGAVERDGRFVTWTMTNSNSAYTHSDLKADAWILKTAFGKNVRHEFPDPYKGYTHYVSWCGESLLYREDGNKVSIVGDRYAMARLLTLLEGANDHSGDAIFKFDPEKAGLWSGILRPTIGVIFGGERFGGMTADCFADRARRLYELRLTAHDGKPWAPYLSKFIRGQYRIIENEVERADDGTRGAYHTLIALSKGIKDANAINAGYAGRFLRDFVLANGTTSAIGKDLWHIYAGLLVDQFSDDLQEDVKNRSRIRAFRFIGKYTSDGDVGPINDTTTWTGWIRDGRNVEWDVSDTNPEFATPEIRARFFEEIIRPAFRRGVGHFAIPPSDSGAGTSVAGLRQLPPAFEPPIDLGMGGGMMTQAMLPLMTAGVGLPLGAQMLIVV